MSSHAGGLLMFVGMFNGMVVFMEPGFCLTDSVWHCPDCLEHQRPLLCLALVAQHRCCLPGLLEVDSVQQHPWREHPIVLHVFDSPRTSLHALVSWYSTYITCGSFLLRCRNWQESRHVRAAPPGCSVLILKLACTACCLMLSQPGQRRRHLRNQ